MSQNKAFVRWARSEGLSYDESTPAANLLVLRAALAPMPEQSFQKKALDNFIKELQSYQKKSTSVPQRVEDVVTDVLADGRIPGWARLAVALVAAREDEAKLLVRHTPALAENGTKLSWHLDETLVNEVFSPVRRLRLASAGLIFHPAIKVEELLPALQEATSRSWDVKVDHLTSYVSWEGAKFTSASEHVEALREHLPKVVYAQLVLALVKNTKALARKGTTYDKAMSMMASAVKDVHWRDLPYAGRGLFPGDVSKVAMRLLGMSGEGHTQLAAVVLSDDLSTRPPVTLNVVKAVVARPKIVDVLPRALHGADKALVAQALEECLVANLAGVFSDDSVVVGLLKELRLDSDPESWRLLDPLQSLLGNYSPIVVNIFADTIGSHYNYFMSANVREIISSAPRWVKQATISFSAASVREFQDLVDTNRGGPLVPTEHADAARAVLLKQGFVPAGGLITGSYFRVIEEINGLFLQEARDWAQSPVDPEMIRAWVKVLPMSAIPELVDSSCNYLSRCNGGGFPGSLGVVIREAYEAAELPLARAALMGTLEVNTYSSTLPQNQSLVEYATSLRGVVAHAS